MTIQNISVSADYCFGSEPLNLHNLGIVNFIFAPNGSGKTTISNALASQPADAAARVRWPVAATALPVRVFNEHYREQVLRERMDGIFTMGSTSSDTVDQIDELEAAKRVRKKERETWITEIGEGGDSPTRTGLLGDLSKEWEIVREAIYAVYRQVNPDVSEIVFKGFQRHKEKFATETLRRHALKLTKTEEVTWESISRRVESVSGEALSRNHMPPLATISIIEESEINDLNATSTTTSSSALSGLIRKLSNEDWVSQGRQYLNNSEGCCPFCQQELSSDFEQKLLEHFASGFDAQLQRAEEIFREVSGRISALRGEIVAMKTFLSSDPFVESEHFLKLISAVEAACEVLLLRVAEKRSHPTSCVDVSGAEDVLQDLRREVDQLNIEIDSHNLLVMNAKEERKKLVEEGWTLFLSDRQVASSISRYNGIKTRKDRDIEDRRTKIATSDALDDEDNERLVDLRERVSNTGEVAERINRTLDAMGFRRFRVEAEGHVAGGYRIVRPDGTLAHESLSEGEKSFLCFVYFWESLFGAKESGAEPEDAVAVIDDPISSLDSETLFLVAAHIRQAATWAISGETNLRQLIVLTHNTQFHHEAAYEVERSSKGRRHYFRLLKGIDGLTTAKDDDNVSKIRGSYPLLWDSVVEAAKSDEESSLVQVGVFNIVRRIVEGYFRTIGQVQEYQRPKGLAVFEERVILMFHMWASSGSHTIADDIDQTIDVGGTQNFLRLFRRYFDLQGHSAHFDMMLQASNGSELAEPGGVFEKWASA